MMENAPLLHTTLSEYYTTEVKRVAGQLTSLDARPYSKLHLLTVSPVEAPFLSSQARNYG